MRELSREPRRERLGRLIGSDFAEPSSVGITDSGLWFHFILESFDHGQGQGGSSVREMFTLLDQTIQPWFPSIETEIDHVLPVAGLVATCVIDFIIYLAAVVQHVRLLASPPRLSHRIFTVSGQPARPIFSICAGRLYFLDHLRLPVRWQHLSELTGTVFSRVTRLNLGNRYRIPWFKIRPEIS